MKKFFPIIVLTIIVISSSVNMASAHPPSKIELSYDDKEQALTVDIAHVTSDVVKHHIRKITLYKNDQELESYYFVTQTPQGLIDKIPLEAKSGDKIRVKVVCKEAGYKEETLAIP